MRRVMMMMVMRVRRVMMETEITIDQVSFPTF